jgi:glycolate oxidase iron-sulfur subunit
MRRQGVMEAWSDGEMKQKTQHHSMTPTLQLSTEARDYFSNCTHCGFCLAVCPTYKLTGDENNSPRGRLRLWSEEAAGRLLQDKWTDFYTAECVGCLACETACPATVP